MVFLLVLYSAVQAATEFLPISSSGHLVLLHSLVPLKGIDPLEYDIVLHWGTLLAVVTALWADLARLFLAWWRGLSCGRPFQTTESRLVWFMIVGTLFPVLVGAMIGDWITSMTRRPDVVLVALLLGGILLLVADRIGNRRKSLAGITLPDAVLVGASQVIAFLPGVSRSGISIITALGRNMNREAAVRFSFLLSIPLVIAAGVREFLIADSPLMTTPSALIIGVGLTAAFGYAIIRFLLRYVSRHSFGIFAWYRIVVAVGITAFLLLR